MKKALRLAVAAGIGFAVTFVVLYYVVVLPAIDSSAGLSPARPLTGTWRGTASFTDRAYSCSYQGTMVLTLAQEGSQLEGSYELVVTNTSGGTSCVRIGSEFSYLVQGSANTSSLVLSVAETDTMRGSFTTDIMTLRWERCDDCGSGPATTIVGMVTLFKDWT